MCLWFQVISWLLCKVFCNAHNSAVSSSWLSHFHYQRSRSVLVAVVPLPRDRQLHADHQLRMDSPPSGSLSCRSYKTISLSLSLDQPPSWYLRRSYLYIYLYPLTHDQPDLYHARQEFTHYFVHILICYAMLTCLTSRRWTENKPRLGSPYSRHHSWLWQVLFSQ